MKGTAKAIYFSVQRGLTKTRIIIARSRIGKNQALAQHKKMRNSFFNIKNGEGDRLILPNLWQTNSVGGS